MSEVSSEAISDTPTASRGGRGGRGGQAPSSGPSQGAGGRFRIYKPSQGYYVRMGTVVGAGVIIVCGAVFLFNELGGSLDPSKAYYLPVQYGVAVGFMALMAAVMYWLVGLYRKANDFFIATEGEMKKVSWSSRKDVIRSTKVVIVAVVLLAVFLFVADIVFMAFFGAIGVLKTGLGVRDLIGIG